MANTTISLDEEAYLVVIGYGQGSEDGYRFVIQQYDASSELVAASVEDTGRVSFGGLIINDQSCPIRVANTDCTATNVARFLRGTTKIELLTIREDGATDISGGELVLRAEESDPPPNLGDGDAYCFKNAGSWWLSVHHAGACSIFQATLVV